MKLTEQQRQAAIDKHKEEALPILEELRDAGFDFSSLDQLRRSHNRYEAALPILVEWLPQVKGLDVKESIIRTLSVPWAKGVATEAILNEFWKAPNDAVLFKWAIGNAMEVIADPSAADAIVEIASNSEHGTARQMFALALGKLHHPRAVEVLRSLLRDDQVAGHAAEALGKLRAVEATEDLEALAKRGKPWVRKEAAKALKKIRA